MAHIPEFRREEIRLYRVGQRDIRPKAQQVVISPGHSSNVPITSLKGDRGDIDSIDRPTLKGRSSNY